MHETRSVLSADIPAMAGDVLSRLKRLSPRVHCITNTVAQAFTANVLLAAGAIPSMTVASQEIADFTARAAALLVNLGTMDNERRESIALALDAAAGHGRAWVLDPVLVDASRQRAEYARTLVARGPSAVRLNAPEFAALAGGPADVERAALFSDRHRTVVGLTGEIDIVCDSARIARIQNGDPLMSRVTAMGCAASALVAACLAVEKDTFFATTAALLVVGVAGEHAGEKARGPGAFASSFLDSLYQLDAGILSDYARVT